MIGAAIGFIELGGLVLAWVIFWNYILRGFCAAHTGSHCYSGSRRRLPRIGKYRPHGDIVGRMRQ